ncbi:cytochrome P450 2J2-like isoform X3 [Biomphalaria glabrata]|uniref:Cytochrome P450 2J2-like isoform X3 n=1 Tax=Biomphalaria glabrata TaxID=6526 RepID=A0A9W2YPP8_BIOGL|nr:cytochrome P450 2J2-like isoform X3 [Biomphalaria glabrata]
MAYSGNPFHSLMALQKKEHLLKMLESVMSCLDVSSCLIGLFILLLAMFFRSRKPKNLPPTPGTALPFVGHLYMLEKNPRQQFKQWAEQFGSMFTLKMGPNTAVFINTLDTLKEAFIKQGDYFSDRPNNLFAVKFSQNFDKGLVLSSGSYWKSQRTTSLAILRNFGMGKNILAEKIIEEISFFTKELARKNGQPSDIRNLTNMSISNIICSIIFGKRFEFGDEKFTELVQMFNEAVKANSADLILNFVPILYYLPFDFFKGKRLLEIIGQLRQFDFEKIREIKKSYDPDNLDNYIVAYIDEMRKEASLDQKSYLDEICLARNIDNLFIAGTETTSTTIMWCLLYMLHYPEVQQRIYKEIVEQIGTERPPNITDKSNLKYLTAVIMEVQRKASIVPLGLPHLCNKDTTLAGYNIPKGTIVMPNLDAIHASKEIWGDPETFRPERFLDDKGNVMTREELMPFSIGRRKCLGESLAKMELFLFLSSLFQQFEFLPASPDKVPPLTKTWGGVAASEPFEIRCVERNK